ncbi:MAG TPA: hypothetical protein VFM71_00590 [Gemmatimonadaceae bacterium]|nr:hypothetical protein [Gemmatimonadaceae bacterium]
MGQTQLAGPCSADVSSGQERAARLWQLVLDGASIPSMRAPRYKRLRDRAAQPSSLARVLGDIRELPALGVTKERAMHLVVVVSHAVEDAYARNRNERVTRAMVEAEMALELAENIATLRALDEDTPEAHEAAAERCDAEIAAQMERARLHRQRANDLRAGVR